MDQDQPINSNSAKPSKNEAWEWIKAFLIAAALVLIVRWLLFAPFIVDGPSMQPNFYTGERLIVNKILYDIRAPKRGEVIVFHAPEGKDYIKRVIALPGETIKVVGDDVFINGKKIKEPYIQSALEQANKAGHPYNTAKDFNETLNGVKAVKVPQDSVFVMGDNRPDSKDSRFEDVGFVPYKKIIGRADIIFWPLDKITWISHKDGVKE